MGYSLFDIFPAKIRCLANALFGEISERPDRPFLRQPGLEVWTKLVSLSNKIIDENHIIEIVLEDFVDQEIDGAGSDVDDILNFFSPQKAREGSNK